MRIEPSFRVKMLPPYLFGKLNAVKYQKRQKGLDVIDLGMGNPMDPTPRKVVDKLCEAVQDPRNHRYSTATGISNLKREVAHVYERRYGVKIDPASEVICTIGSKEGFSHFCLAMLGPGDLVVVPQPAYPIHSFAVALAGASVVGVRLESEEQILRDVEHAMKTFMPRPKAVVLNFPHNPTARTVDLGFFEDMARMARRLRFLVISDMAYAATTFDGYKAPSFLQTKYGKDVAIEFSTMSKEYNMAGWRIGFAVGNAEAVGALGRLKAYYDYGIFQPVQIAAIIAMRHCATEAAEQAMRYQRRRDILCDGLTRAGWAVEKPRASMFVWVKIPPPYAKMGSIKFAYEMMDKALVAAAPGAGFGEAGEGCLRLALVENEKRLRQAVAQIRRAFPVAAKPE
jgi:alanine-synthesizing transaminase